MFPSNNNNNNNNNNGFLNNDQVWFTDQSILHRPFLGDITNSKQDQDPPLSFFHFSSPFLHYESALEDDRDVFLQQHHDLLFLSQQPLRAENNTNLSEIFVNMADSSQNDVNGLTKDCRKKSHGQQIPRKRASKRDRHSKINTAKGLRDRRMRLSLDVARNFFGLQDMLGYDKASKTVEWLLLQAKQEIRKLEKGLPQMNNNNSCVSVGAKSASSTSECTIEVASGLDEAAIRKSNLSKAKPSIKGKKIRQSTSLGPLARDLRAKARARARERTIEKMRSRNLNDSNEAKSDDLNQLGSWSSFETGEESGTHSHNINHSLQVLAEVEDPSSHQEAVVDDSLINMGKWSPFSSIINCLHNIGTPQEHQLTDFQFFSKP